MLRTPRAPRRKRGLRWAGVRRRVVGEGEVAGTDGFGNAAIYDIDAEAMIWQATPESGIAPAGPNHVLVSTGARVDLVRWR